MATFEVYEPNINTTTKYTFVQNIIDTTELEEQWNSLAQVPKMISTTEIQHLQAYSHFQKWQKLLIL